MVTWSQKSTHLCESLLLPHGLARASGGEKNESGFMVYFFLGTWKSLLKYIIEDFILISSHLLHSLSGASTPSAIQGNLVAIGFISSGAIENYT